MYEQEIKRTNVICKISDDFTKIMFSNNYENYIITKDQIKEQHIDATNKVVIGEQYTQRKIKELYERKVSYVIPVDIDDIN